MSIRRTFVTLLFLSVLLVVPETAGGCRTPGQIVPDPWPMGVTLEYPENSDPTILSGSDSSSVCRVERLGGHTFRLVNFDSSVDFVLSENPQLNLPKVTVCNSGGANGPDPIPTINGLWHRAGVLVGDFSLLPGVCSSCVGCELEVEWAP